MDKHAGIQNGLNTHHQDQSIVPTSFNTIKTINKRLQKPIPPLLFSIIFIILICIYLQSLFQKPKQWYNRT